jgi:hypothetical protein
MPKRSSGSTTTNKDLSFQIIQKTVCSTLSVKMKKIVVIALSCVAFIIVVLCGFLLFRGSTSTPPKEAKLIQNFNENRAAFEKLRDMLQADEQVTRVGSWGIATIKSPVPQIPPEASFPVNRYNEYMALLKQVGGISAWRHEGKHADPEIVVWRWGWAGGGHSVAVCWMDPGPTNQVASLDDYFQKPIRSDGSTFVYRYIDEKWFLWGQ